MARCAKCGKMSGVPSGIKLKDTSTGTVQSVKTDAVFPGAKRPTLKDQRGMNQSKLSAPNPLGK